VWLGIRLLELVSYWRLLLVMVRCFDVVCIVFFFFQAEDGIRDSSVTGVQTCAFRS